MILLLALLACGAPAPTCGVDEPCQVAEGAYWRRPAVGDSLGTLVFLHGWGGDAGRWSGRLSAFTEAGYQVLVPQAIDGRWNVAAWEAEGRDESAFIDAVIDDSDASGDPIFLAGYSVGASIVYERACNRGDAFTAFATMSGTFWQPLPESCASGPIDLRHLHGEQDTTFPLSGRSMGSMGGQGNTDEALALLRQHDGCVAAPVPSIEPGLSCERWVCDQSELRKCLHPGGHPLPAGWELGVRDWFLGF